MYFGDKAHGEINKILKKRSQKKIHFLNLKNVRVKKMIIVSKKLK